MINFNILKKIKRVREEDKRNFKKGIRSDRNEKVENWPSNIFQKIFSKISNHEFTAYYNTSELLSLESKIANYYKIKIRNFIINHGGDGVIKEFLLSNYKNKMRVLINSNNYGMYKVYFKGLNIKYNEIPYIFDKKNKNLFQLDKKYLKRYIRKSDIFFYTNPNVVSNSDISLKDFNNLCKKYPKKLFFIDESYIGFGQKTYLKLIRNNKNIYIMRSITKTFGLASARVGFLIAHHESIKPYKALQTPYPVSLFSGKCLEYFIANKTIVNTYNSNVSKGREFFCKELKKKNYLVNNGKGLSILIYFTSKKSLKTQYKKLEKNYIYTKMVKVNSNYFLRVTCSPVKTMKKIIKFF